MSKLELSAIQTKLKAAIQNHQMLVVKMKGDNQNAALKKGLAELQDEIRRLSEEQKKLVVKFKESLVKPSSQHQPQLQPQPPPPPATPIASVASVGQTITAIGQPRLVSFPTQGGATILPVGMVAVPIAHMQRPAVGVAIHSAGAGQMPQAASISLIPTGIIGSTCNISLNPINNAGAISIGNNVGGIIHGNIAIGNFSATNIGSVTTTTTTTSTNTTAATTLSSGLGNESLQSSNISTSNSGAGCCVSVAPTSNIALTNLTNMSNIIIGNNINNNHIVTNTSLTTTGCLVNVNNATVVASAALNSQVNTTASSNAGATGIVISQFPQQPLVQPQLLQQQQQQILKMIQQQQQQQQLPQQRLVSHMPIKVPQYTASVIRPAVSTTSVQYCNIAPAPSTVALTPTVKAVPSTTTVPATAKQSPSKDSIPAPKEVKDTQPVPKSETSKPQQPQPHKQPAQPQQQSKQQQQAAPPPPPAPPQQQQKQQRRPSHQEQRPQTPAVVVKQLNPEEEEKLKFMQALDLYTNEVLKEMMARKNERKRRTTANPNYSFGFEMSRRDRNGTIWSPIPPKKSRLGKGRGSSAPRANGWSDSTSVHCLQQKSSSKSMSNDNHDDYCAVCGKGGQLLMCETCRLVYHLDCLSPPLSEAPKYAWSCPKCLVSGKKLAHISNEAMAKVHSYIARRAAKEDERKKLERKGREINIEKNFLDSRSKELDTKMKEQVEQQSKLLDDEKKVREDLNKLSDFVRTMRETRTAEHLAGPKSNSSSSCCNSSVV